jgi:hypothetical protein
MPDDFPRYREQLTFEKRLQALGLFDSPRGKNFTFRDFIERVEIQAANGIGEPEAGPGVLRGVLRHRYRAGDVLSRIADWVRRRWVFSHV